MLVAEHLNLDVARIGDEFLDEDAVVAEGRLRLRTRAREALRDFLARMSDAHALAAAAGGRLDHHRETDLLSDFQRMRLILDHTEKTRHGGDFGVGGGLFRFDLVAHDGDGVRIRPDKDDAGRRQRRGEGFALGEKSVAGMHRLRACALGGVHDLADDQIALCRRRRADQDRFIRHLDMASVPVGFGIDGDGFDSQPARGLDDPAGNLAAIGDQDTLEHAAANPLGNPFFPASGGKLNNSLIGRNAGKSFSGCATGAVAGAPLYRCLNS